VKSFANLTSSVEADIH